MSAIEILIFCVVVWTIACYKHCKTDYNNNKILFHDYWD